MFTATVNIHSVIAASIFEPQYSDLYLQSQAEPLNAK